jgi:hypothetical protein
MSIAFFIVGGVIFSIYVYFLIWNIFTSNRKQREENYYGYYQRHGMVDNMDMDGHGNYGRFVPEKKVVKRKN